MNDSGQPSAPRCGTAVILGRPNVGKSTLLNRLLRCNISITSRRALTTRQGIAGIATEGQIQTVYMDTPGMEAAKATRRGNETAGHWLETADLKLLVIAAPRWTAADQWVLEQIEEPSQQRLILVINKSDLMRPPQQMLPLLAESNQRGSFAELVPVSAQRGHNIERLEQCVAKYLPRAAHRYPANINTDRDRSFQSVEMVREQLLRRLGKELPFVIEPCLESIAEVEGTLQINIALQVPRASHRPIVLGHRGSMIGNIRSGACASMRRLFELPVQLQLRVRVRKN